jgi:hypothetical protein
MYCFHTNPIRTELVRKQGLSFHRQAGYGLRILLHVPRRRLSHDVLNLSQFIYKHLCTKLRIQNKISFTARTRFDVY